MNYFCHAILSDQTPQGLAGAIGGDAIKGIKAVEELSKPFQNSVREHRHVDELSRDLAFHDWMRERLPDSLNRYTGIFTDLVFDHMLYRVKDKLMEQSPSEYAASVEEKIKSIETIIPYQILEELKPIRKYRLILACEKEENLQSVLKGITNRFKRYKPPMPLDEGLVYFYDQLPETTEMVWKDFKYLKKGTEEFRS